MFLLSGENITCGYGSVDIVSNCNIGVKKGEISSIVGPNGAGKSTAMKALFGLLPLKNGRVLLNGEDITNLKPQQRVLKGMGFVPQSNNIFPSLTVQENLEMGAFIDQSSLKEMLEYVFELFPALIDKKHQEAGELSGGQRQQVAVGRALMTKPKVLMLDEPSAGVSPIIMDGLFNKVLQIAKEGTAVLMVEQNAKQALKISDLGFVLNQGKNLYTDNGNSLLKNKQVRQAFLGG